MPSAICQHIIAIIYDLRGQAALIVSCVFESNPTLGYRGCRNEGSLAVLSVHSNVGFLFFLKPEVSQNIKLCMFGYCQDFCRISSFLAHSTSFPAGPSPSLFCFQSESDM